jgi:hypothetical protein
MFFLAFRSVWNYVHNSAPAMPSLIKAAFLIFLGIGLIRLLKAAFLGFIILYVDYFIESVFAVMSCPHDQRVLFVFHIISKIFLLAWLLWYWRYFFRPKPYVRQDAW